jgi:branched-chain amino acid transport system substrate-binding protein
MDAGKTRAKEEREMSKPMWRCVSASLAMLLVVGSAAFAEETIKIGVFGPMTGGAAGYGQSEREAIDLVVEEVNAGGGVLGKKVQVLYGDDAGKPEQAVSIVSRFITADEILLVLGGISSPTSMAVSQVTGQEKVPQIIVAATAARITKQNNPWVFRSAVPDTKLAGDLADFLHQRFPKVKRIGAIYVNDDFGKGGVTAFSERAKQHGIQIVADEKYTRGDVDFTAQLTKIKSVNADAILDWSRYHEGALIARQVKQMGVTLPIFGADGAAHPKYIELGRDAVEGVHYATHFSPATSGHLPAARKLVEKMRAKYGKDPDFIHAEAYDAALVAVDAIRRAGSLDRDKIRRAIAATDIEGTRGRIRFDVNGDPTFETHIVKIVGGKETNGR